MANAIFSLKAEVTNSSAVSSSLFDIDVTVTDVFPVFSAADIQVDDLLFLDFTQVSGREGTVNRYKVTVINSASGSSANLRVQYDDSGDAVDPIEALGYVGFIARPSSLLKLARLNLYDLYGVPPYIVTYALNTELWTKIDPLGGSTGGSAPYTRIFNFIGCRVYLQVLGSQSDADAVSANFTATNTVTLSNISSELELLNMTVQLDDDTNSTTSFNFVYPETNGNTTLATSSLPSLQVYNPAGVIMPVSNIIISNDAGILTVTRSGLVAGLNYSFKLDF